MSADLWQRLPERFLKMGYPRFLKHDGEVRQLIVDLAEAQKFKCAICRERSKNLVVDHDHYPEDGPGDRITVFNIRGLVCSACNWDLGFYEKEERGEAFGWENVECKLSTDKLRIDRVREALLEQKVPNYWHRRIVLDRFDRWYYGWERPPKWYRDYKEQQSRKIETPEDFFRLLTEVIKFIKGEMEKDPNYIPPKEFLEMMGKIRPFLEEVISSAKIGDATTK
jgi:hypothetical protein